MYLGLAVMLGMVGCTPEQELPTVVTGDAEAYSTTHTIMCQGDVTDDGGSPVTERGICYLEGVGAPTIEGAHEKAGSGKGNFSVVLQDLSTGTYSYRAYAVNSVGISYGEVKEVTMACNMATVVTGNATANASTLSASCSGNVTNDGGGTVSTRGICYMKGSGNPTINNWKVVNGNGTGSFTCTLQNLNVGTYSYRAYATNEAGTSYGATKTFTIPAFDNYGASTKLFSVSATKKVRFSKGNLRYQPSTHNWSIASEQYNFAADNNQSPSASYSGVIDLFGYGTSGRYCGATCYQPYSTSTDDTKYLSSDLTGQYENGDWGVNHTIYFGNNSSTGWRTLTAAEWNYLLTNCTYGAATIDNIIRGLVILPTSFTMPSGLTFHTGFPNGWSTNTIAMSDWLNMEKEGAIFLPAAGERDGADYTNAGWGFSGIGGYWSASGTGSNYTSYCVYFTPNGLSNHGEPKSCGHSVRLVKDN